MKIPLPLQTLISPSHKRFWLWVGKQGSKEVGVSNFDMLIPRRDEN